MERFPVTLARDGKVLLVRFPDFPEAQTFGETEEEALTRAVDALETAIIGRMGDREKSPVPGPARRRHTVTLPPLASAKVALYRRMRAAGVSKADLGRRLGLHGPQVDRLLDLRHASRLDQLDRALHVLGMRLVLDVQAA